jgi:hypothetical protein
VITTLIIHILIAALIAGVLLWALSQIPPLAPFYAILRTLVIVLFAVWLILQLLPLMGIH